MRRGKDSDLMELIFFRRPGKLLEAFGFNFLRSRKYQESFVLNFLKLFSQFTQLPTIFNADKLFDVFMKLLQKDAPELQEITVVCLLKWKLPYLVPYAENLKALAADKAARRVLMTWSLGKRERDEIGYMEEEELKTAEGKKKLEASRTKTADKAKELVPEEVKEEHREELMKVVISILLPRLVSRRNVAGRKGKGNKVRWR